MLELNTADVSRAEGTTQESSGADDGLSFADTPGGHSSRAQSRDSPLLFRLADFNDVAVGIAHVAPRLGLVNLRFGEKLRT